MTGRQVFLKLLYPFIMLKGKLFPGDTSIQLTAKKVTAPVAFHSLTTTANNGSFIDFKQFKGKKVLIVNTASNCGFTGQYADLEKLYTEHEGKLVIIGFPANDFKQQEQLDDAGIAAFCKINFGVTFPLAQKSEVIKGETQNNIFQWLTQAAKNGWCNQEPLWNFCKYLVDEEGNLIGFFAHSVSPLDDKLVSLL